MIRKIKTSRNKNPKNLAGLLGGGITRPPSQFESNSLFADPNLHVPGERLFGPQASLRITPMRQCDSNPRPLATFAVFVAHHVNHLATLTSLGNISINSRGEQFLKFGGPTESACMSDKLKCTRFKQIVSSIDQQRAWQVARLPRELKSVVFQLS